MQNVVALPISYVTLNKMNPLSGSPIQPSAATTMDNLGQAPSPRAPLQEATPPPPRETTTHSLFLGLPCNPY